MVSVICCYNDEKQYKEMSDSLSVQNMEYELVGVDNRDNRFSSAASALNYGAEKACGEILIFLHQDILFEKVDSLRLFVESIPTDRDAIVGLYGASHNSCELIDNILTTAQTLDECFVAMKRSVWDKYRFNEKICDNWHLYVVELCLRASKDNVLIVYGTFSIQHLSIGTVNETYMQTYKELLKIYKDEKWIATTCKSMPTNLAYFYVYYFVWKCKKGLLGNFPLMDYIKRLVKG